MLMFVEVLLYFVVSLVAFHIKWTNRKHGSVS